MPARAASPLRKLLTRCRLHGPNGPNQTPVGFKYIGQLIREDKIALGGEESAGLTFAPHPLKDGILAFLLVANDRRAASLPSATKFARCTGTRPRILARPQNLLSPTTKGKRRQAGGRYASTLPATSHIHRRRDVRKFFWTMVRGCFCVCSARSRCFAGTSKSEKRRRFRS